MLVKEILLLLDHLINEEDYFSLQQLNSCLLRVELGYMEETDRPSPITQKNLRERKSFSLGMLLNVMQY